MIKLAWVLDKSTEEFANVRKLVAENKLMYGTVDTWLVYNLTGGTYSV